MENKYKSIQNMKEVDIETALTFKTSKLDTTIDFTLKSNFKTSAVDPDLEKLCIMCIASKSTRTEVQHKNMIPIYEKLEEVQADL